MQLTCPHCGFSKQIDRAQLPPDATKVNCPKCKQSFPLQQPDAEPEPTPKKETGTSQPPPDAVFNKKPMGATTNIEMLPKAGFWMRVVAALIDGFIVFALQFLLGALLAVAGFAAAGGAETAGSITLVVQLFGFIISVAYYVIFTGHGGQTPGKMALRIKVINRDGTQISYGRAAFREIPGKFISGIIFGIGYLMVAFDDQKQGLHDRMANTYVIKL